MHNHQSLFYKVYKARYFPHVSFLQSSPDRNPFFVWKGIYEAEKILMEECRLRVGDGQKIKIWGDKWLLTLMTYKVTTPRRAFDDDAKVSNLIDQA